MSYSEYPPGGAGASYGQEGGYGEYGYGGGGGAGGGEPEETTDDVMGYLSPKVQMLRRLRAVVLVVELLLMIVFIWLGYTWRMSEFEGYATKPWWPLQPTLFYILLFGVIMSITGIVFRLLEMKTTESGSQKVLLANSAFRGALTTFAVALAFLIIIWYLPQSDFLKGALTSEEDSSKEYGEESYRFKVQDEFQLTRVTRITVTTDQEETLGLMRKEVGENFTKLYGDYTDNPNYYPNLMNYVNSSGDPNVSGITLLFNSTRLTKDTTRLRYGEWRIYTNVQTGTGAKIHYKIVREIQPDLLGALLTFLLVLTVMDGAWMAVALVIKQKYKGYSIYT
ncbi:MAG: hypothetical protein FJ149_08960 [Euryarchaeota archaeon]|nr:hypothetical protein [Euryarchaeota archaeon]